MRAGSRATVRHMKILMAVVMTVVAILMFVRAAR
jgi:hypothetical protein